MKKLVFFAIFIFFLNFLFADTQKFQEEIDNLFPDGISIKTILIKDSSKKEVEPFIVNGTDTGYKSYQGVIGIKFHVPEGDAICTGTLIDPEVIITAGHCVAEKGIQNGYNSNFEIVAGANILWNPIKVAGVAKVEANPNWNGQPGQSVDLAMIHLSSKVSDYPIYKVNTEDNVQIGDTGIIVGYGITRTGAYDSGIHRMGHTSVLNKNTYSGLIELGNPSGTCQGDSGGPFFIKQDGKDIITGVTSFGGQTCYADKGGWDVYLPLYKDWINSMVKKWTGHELNQKAEFSCSQIGNCINKCDNIECKNQCYDNGTEASKQQYDIFSSCMNGQCNSETDFSSQCAKTKCPFETNQCFGTNYPYCGNKIVEPGEECDDGNLKDNDGCSSKCKKENLCGNGNIDSGEECDDGNKISGDGCSSNCKFEKKPAKKEESGCSLILF